MKRHIPVWMLVTSLTGCASWCNNSSDYQKCINRVHAAQAVTAAALVVTAVVLVAKKSGGGGGGADDESQPTNYGRPYPGNCQYDWQVAADGSRCGARSAESRPGGY
jgi:hypothetical protein